MKQTIRTFVAAELGPAVRSAAQALIDAMSKAQADVRWVATENLHLTLKFLGEVPLLEIPSVCEAVSVAVREFAPFELEIRGTGAFPNAGRPRTIWLGAGGGKAEMVALQARIDAGLKKIGYPPEGRQFQPHLTIGRVRGGGPALADLGRLIQEHADDPLGVLAVDEVVVFSSQLDRAGPAYGVLGRGELQG